MKYKKIITTIFILLTVLLAACNGAAAPDLSAEAEMVEAFIGDLSATASATGVVEVGREARLALQSAGIVAQLPVHIGQTVQKGDPLMVLDSTDLQLNVATAEQALRIQEANLASLQKPASDAELAAAEANVRSAQAQLESLQAGVSADQLADAEANLQAAQAQISNAYSNLSQTQNSVTAAQIAAAEAKLASAIAQQKTAQINYDQKPSDSSQQTLGNANAAVAVAQAELDALLAGPDANAVSAAQANYSNAIAQRDAAQANLDQLNAGTSPTQIAAAQAQLTQAQANLANLQQPPHPAQLRTAQAQLQQAHLNLQAAQEALANATLIAPFDGIVTAIHVVEGEFATGRAIDLADLSTLQLVLSVDEIDIGSLAIGQTANVILETWPDQTISSQISRIAPSGIVDTANELIIYNVYLTLDQTDLPVRIGMTANATLITAERKAVLLVPNRAIQADRSKGIYTVQLVQEETVQTVEVTIGLRDRQNTEIRTGLTAGDRLRVQPIIADDFEGPPQFGG